ncbi:hypothetical protein HGA64_05480 [Candidatus Falkowbacteria bacterium]|nr:hypothetical protein [Candidatus Falkowbacteria bacterium]
MGTLWGFYYIRIYFAAILILNIADWVVAVALKYNATQDQIVLHYNVDFGVDLYGDSGRVFLLPLLGLIIFLTNSLLVVNANKHDRGVSHGLMAVATLCNFLLLIAQISLYSYNLR